MSTDKTLADVQPGGRVRLGDQAERARFEAWPQAREFEIQKDGSGEYLSEVTHGAWLAWKYLSAQPSPGGQDGLVQEALEYFERAGDAGDRQYVAAIRAALAARQPVGEPVAWMIERLRGKGYGRDKYVVMKGQASSDPDSHLFWADQQARDNHRVTPLYASPAQAVELAMTIAMIDRALGHLSTALDDLDSSPDRRPGAMVTEAMACLRQALTGVPHG